MHPRSWVAGRGQPGSPVAMPQTGDYREEEILELEGGSACGIFTRSGLRPVVHIVAGPLDDRAHRPRAFFDFMQNIPHRASEQHHQQDRFDHDPK